MTRATFDFAFAITHTAAGGLREIWNDVASGLEARGHRVAKVGLYRTCDPAGAPEGDAEGWRYLVDVPLSSPFAVLRVLYRAICFLRQARPNVVVTAMPLANVLWPLACTLARVPTRVVITHHSPADTHNRWLNRMDGLTGQLRCVTRVVSVSHAVGDSLAGKAARYRAKRQTIHNALPAPVEERLETLWTKRSRIFDVPAGTRDEAAGAITDKTADDTATETAGGTAGGTTGEATGEAGAGMLHVVALGRLSYQKNYPLAIRALAEAGNVRLTIAGGGEDEEALRALTVQCGVSDRVAFLGHVTRDKALEVLSEADVFLQVSHYEGHSLALIEAARLGIPLVVSDVPVQVEAVTHPDARQCGLIVPVDQPAVLASVLDTLDQAPALQRHWAGLARDLGLAASNAAMIDAYEGLLGADTNRGAASLPAAPTDRQAR